MQARLAAGQRRGRLSLKQGRTTVWQRCVQLVLMAWLTALCQPLAHAARLQVRARTTLSVQWQAESRAPHLAGRLVDARDRPVPGADVTLRVTMGATNEPETRRMRTDDDGRIALPWPVDGTGTLHVEAAYFGDAAYGPADAETTVDIAKQQPQIAVDKTNQTWRMSEPAWQPALTVTATGRPLANVAVVLRVEGREVVQVRTDAQGRAVAAVPWSVVGPVGAHVASAEIAEDDQYNSAQVKWNFETVGAVLVAAHAQPGGTGTPCADGDWCLHGRAQVVTGAQPEPLVGAAVTLQMDGRVIGSLVTQEDGNFAAMLRTSALRPLARQGVATVVVAVASGRPAIEDGWSQPLQLALPQPERWAEWLGGAALAALLLAYGLRRWLATRRVQQALQQAENSQAGLPGADLLPGDVVGGAVFRVAGTVQHGEYGRPMAAQLTLRHHGNETLLRSAAEAGTFAWESLPVGTWTLTVQAPEHEALDVTLTIPHDGRFDGCTLLPVSRRAQVRGALSSALRQATGAGVDWSRETPRLVEPRWVRPLRRGRIEIREAVRAVERALYGRRTEALDVEAAQRSIAKVDEVQR